MIYIALVIHYDEMHILSVVNVQEAFIVNFPVMKFESIISSIIEH